MSDHSVLLPLAEAQSINWLNSFFAKLWPKINETAKKIVAEQVEPQIQAAVPDVAKGIHFKEFTLGTTPFVLGPMKVYDLNQKGLMLRVGIDFKSDSDITIHAMGVDVGVKNLTMTGELTLRFNPLIKESPVVGAVVVYFLDPPNIAFDFTGIGSILNVKGLSGIIRNTVTNVVSGMMVLPNQMPVCLGTEDQGVDLAKIKYPTPTALLRVQPKRARGLKGSDWHLFGKATSDPYCIVEMSDESFRSSTVKKTCDPDWPETDYGYFMLYDRAQKISLKVLDEDFGTADDSLGYSEAIKAALALEDPKIMDPGMALYPKACKPGQNPEGKVCGHVSLGIDFFQIDFAKGSLGESEMCILQVKLDKAILPPKAENEAKVKVTLKNGDYTVCKTSPVGKAPEKKSVEKGVEKTLVGVVKRCKEKQMDVDQIAELVDLPAADVQVVIDGGSVAQTSKASQMVDIETTLHFVARRDKLDNNAVVELVVATKKDKTVASATVNLGDVLNATDLHWGKDGRVVCKGHGGDVPLDVQIRIHPTELIPREQIPSLASSAPHGWEAIRKDYFGECSKDVEGYYDDDWANNAGNWALEQSAGGKNNDFSEHHFKGKALILTKVQSVAKAIELLNSSEGHVACPEGFCVVYSESKKLYFLIFRKDKVRKAHKLFPDCFHDQ